MKLNATIIIAIIASYYSFSFAISSWEQRADFGAEGRHRGAGLSIGNKGYIGLGHYNGSGTNIVKNDWWEYDPATDAWTQKANFTGNSGNGNYAVLTFTIEGGTSGYVGGGQWGSGTEMLKYTPATNTWTNVASIPTNAQNTQGFAIGTNCYFVDFSTLWEYNTVTDTWTNKGSVPFSINWWNSAFAVNGKGYIKTTNQIWEYKPLTNQWISRAPFPGVASSGSATFTQNGKGYIVGGYTGSLSNVNSEVWEFDPATNQWNQKAEFLGTSRRFAAAFSIGNRAYLGTGTNGTNFNDFWEFDGSILEVNESTTLSVLTYPNPVTESVSFKFDNTIAGEIKIFNSNGQQVAVISLNQKEVSFNRGNNPNGIYFYTIENNGEIIYQNKLIFQ